MDTAGGTKRKEPCRWYSTWPSFHFFFSINRFYLLVLLLGQQGVWPLLQLALQGAFCPHLVVALQLAFSLQQGVADWQLLLQLPLQEACFPQVALHSLPLQSAQAPLQSLHLQSVHLHSFLAHSFLQHSVLAFSLLVFWATAGKAIIEAAAIHARISNFFIGYNVFNEITVQI